MRLDRLRGKPITELRELLAGVDREELIRLLSITLSVEPTMRASEIAAVSQRPRAAVLRAIRNHEMGDYFCFGENSLTVPVSGVNRWRDGFKVSEDAISDRRFKSR